MNYTKLEPKNYHGGVNQMIAQAAPKYQPIVLAINADSGEIDCVLENDLVRHVFGTTSRTVEIEVPRWYFKPPASLAEVDEIAKVVPRLTDDELEEWVTSQDFRVFVASDVAKKLDKKVNRNDVQVVVLDGARELSKYAHRSLTNLFPNAIIVEEDGEEVRYYDTVLLEDLGLRKSVYDALCRRGTYTVAQLSGMNEAQVLAIDNIGKVALKNIKSALSGLGLTLRQD